MLPTSSPATDSSSSGRITLTGFNTLKREGIVLTAGFTATVNADLPVGALEETVTVSGEAPLVDTQNTRQQTQLSAETLKALPRSQGAIMTIAAFTPGATSNVEVGASQAASWSEQANASRALRYHGKAARRQRGRRAASPGCEKPGRDAVGLY